MKLRPVGGAGVGAVRRLKRDPVRSKEEQAGGDRSCNSTFSRERSNSVHTSTSELKEHEMLYTPNIKTFSFKRKENKPSTHSFLHLDTDPYASSQLLKGFQQPVYK